MDENNVRPDFPYDNEPVESENSYNTQRGGNGFSIASMVLGIVALVLFCTGIFSIICSILAIIFAALALNRKLPGRGMAIAGLVTGIVALIPAIIVIVVAGVSYAAILSSVQSYL